MCRTKEKKGSVETHFTFLLPLSRSRHRYDSFIFTKSFSQNMYLCENSTLDVRGYVQKVYSESFQKTQNLKASYKLLSILWNMITLLFLSHDSLKMFISKNILNTWLSHENEKDDDSWICRKSDISHAKNATQDVLPRSPIFWWENLKFQFYRLPTT